MEDYRPNSNRFKEQQKQESAEKKKVEKVVKGKVQIKENKVRKFTDVFVSEDISTVKEHVFSEVLIPAAKKLIWDIVTDGIDMILYGGSKKSQRSSSSNVPYVSYNRFSDPRDDYRRDNNARTTNRFDYETLNFDNRGDAEMVLKHMEDIRREYGVVTVSDLYDLMGISSPYTSNRYGWTDISSATTVRGRDGYNLRLPKASPID